jgi:alpha-L-fucosidase
VKTTKKLFYLLLLGSVMVIFTFSSKPVKKEIAPENRMDWWTNAKFGMFIHWGVYSVPAGVYKGQEVRGIGEWIMNHAKIPMAEYQKYASQFNPVKYDPEAWVKMAKDAGMKYIVITSKHHDGFALFDSKVTKWNVVDATPYGKDLLKPLAAACKKEGMKLGFYYSQAQDWNHPGGAATGGHWDPAQNGSMDEYIDKIAVPQVKEILSRYGEIAILWWDTPTDMNKERAEKFLPVLAKYPNLITNDRLGGGIKGDTETPEQYIPATGFSGRHWEVCMTMNDTWGYKTNDHNWKSTKDLILKLSDIVSKGGNFLLNVGPTSEGVIPQPSIDRLRQVGEWMKVNGDAIYGTSANPFPYLPWGRTTIKGQKLFLHVVEWPKDGILKLPMRNKAVKAYMMANTQKELGISQDADFIKISVPAVAPDTLLPVVALDFEGKPDVLPIPTAGAIAKASSVNPEKPLSNLFDGDLKNRWEPAADEKESWIEVDLGKPTSIENITLWEPWGPRDNHGQEIQLLVKKGDNWDKIVEGKTRGSGFSQSFAPVTGQYFRLNIKGSKGEVPAICEWILNRAI